MIIQEQLNQIAQFINQQEIISDSVVDQLRQRFADIHFTYCMNDDVVGSTPVSEFSNFNLYLIDSREHCLCFTQNKDIASGVVVAEIEQE